MSEQNRLVVMANQIGQFFASSQSEARAVEATAEHLRKFWEKRMRRAGVALLRQGGDRLDPVPRQALERLAAEDAAAPDAHPTDPPHAASNKSDSAI